jgi:CTP:phosphocholine cytidylyltransferase-like protein/thiamine kinase-like enzyme
VDNAIILAAGFGSRFVPFTYETPKGLLKVKGKPMVERQIEQLRERGVSEIILVVGYLKEKFEYLIPKYGVTLVFNPEYAVKNNFVSVYYALAHLKRTYILAADHWLEENIFRSEEGGSWLSCTWFDGPTEEWGVTAGPDGQIEKIEACGRDTWALNGPAFFDAEFSRKFAALVRENYEKPGSENDYWEHIVMRRLAELPPIRINRQRAESIHEFEDLESLRAFDERYRGVTGNAAMQLIASTFGVPEGAVRVVAPLKEGMTNKSFLFAVGGETYVFRLPGPGTDKLIDRAGEKRSYELVAPLDISDEILYCDAETGIKIARYYEGARVSDPEDDAEVAVLMRLLKRIHDAGIRPEHRFDIRKLIDMYEKLAKGLDSIRFPDYEEVRAKADELLDFRDALAIPEVLCHNDYVYTNVLHLPDGSIRVIDWEYSGAADPLIDIAMFSIYTYYDRARMDRALAHYLGRAPSRQEQARLYLYVALGAFLWSLWTEYKQGLGEEFGEYRLIQYQYMKDFHAVLKEEGFLNGF